jgi:hypothetical protein
MTPLLSTLGGGSARALGLFSAKSDIVINPVTSGLQFSLDASNPASYPGSGSAVYDISGNGRHGVFNNGNVTWVAKSGSSPAYFKFNGSSDGDYLYQNQGSSYYCYDLVIGMMVTDATTFLGCVYSYVGANDKSLRLYEDGSSNWGFRGGSQPPDGNDWNYNETAKTLINNLQPLSYPNLYPINTWGIARSYSSNGNFVRPHTYMLGANAYPGRQLRGRINFIHGYNRELSNAEIQSIYGAYKTRLGIA